MTALTRSTLLRHLGVALLAAGALFVFTQAASDIRNFQALQVCYYLLPAAGLTLLTGLSGQISLGQGALMMFGGYTVALGIQHLSWPLWLLLVAAVAVSAAAGAVVGAAAARLRGPYLAGLTLALAVGVPRIASRYPSLGKDAGLNFAQPSAPAWLGANFSSTEWQAWIACLAALAGLVLLANVMTSRFGRTLRAVRDDEVAAALSGVAVARTQVLAFVVASGAAGLGGALLAVANGNVAPSGFDLSMSLALLTAAVVGGLGSITGAVYGAILLVVLPKLADSVTTGAGLAAGQGAYVQLAIYGLALIATMLVAPGGVHGVLRGLTRPLLSGLRSVGPARAQPAPGSPTDGSPAVTLAGPAGTPIAPAQTHVPAPPSQEVL